MGRFKLALVQLDSVFGDLETNLTKAERYIREAAANGANLICLPEAFNTGYYCNGIQKMAEMAEKLDGPTITRMSALARTCGVYLVVPFIQDVGGGKAENSAALIDDTGAIVGIHSKTHPVGDEAVYFRRGTQYSVFPTKYGKIGLLICYDVCFPETSRILALKGADLLCVPIACRHLSYFRNWTLAILNARALDNVLYVAGVCMTGNAFPDSPFTGSSVVFGPSGETLALAPEDDEMVLYQEIDLDAVPRERQVNTVLSDRHPEDYHPLIQ